MRDSIDLTRLKGLKLAVASSCDLKYFVNSVRAQEVFAEVAYNFDAGTSDDASIEMRRPDSLMAGADVIVASIAETCKKFVHPLMMGRTGVDIEAMFGRVERALRDLFDYLEASSAKACFVFRYPLNRTKIDINDRPWVPGSISHWLQRMDNLYLDLLASGRYSKIDLLDLDEALSGVGYTARHYRNEFWGGHPEVPGAELLAGLFWERLVSRLDHAGKVKAIALDLDHTLWDGVFLESEAAPAVFRNRAVALAHHANKGIPTCVVSKNNPEDAERIRQLVLQAAPDLARVIVAWYVGWSPKSDSIRRMAATLGIGTEAIALFDDNSFERGEVAFALPGTRVYAETELEGSLRYGEFSAPRLSADAGRRVQSYREHVQRASDEAAATDTDLDAYLHSLDFRIAFRQARRGDLDRVEELVQRTNQQNLLLNRTARAELGRQIDRGKAVLVSLSDRFGDYGTIGVMVHGGENGVVRLQELAISCRALGKGVEECIIAFIGRYFAGQRQLRFPVRRTYRNEAFFQKMLQSGLAFDEAASEMSMDLPGSLDYPAWFAVEDGLDDPAASSGPIRAAG